MAVNKAEIVISAKDETKAAFASVKSGFDMISGLATRGLLAIGGATGLVEFGKAAIDAAKEAEQSSARISATLKATGYSAGLATDSIEQMVDALKASTQFDDEPIRNAAATFLKFGNIQDGVFQRGLKSAADLAAFMGTDIPEAAQMIGKALSSPTEGVGALERQIGKLSEAQKASIKAFDDSGNKVGAQNALLEVLDSKIGGTADTMNKGLTKATNDLSKAWDDMLETLGRTPAVEKSVTGVMDLLTGALRGADVDKWAEIGKKLQQAQNVKPLGFSTDATGRTTFNAGDLPRIGEQDKADLGRVASERQAKADDAAAKSAKEKADREKLAAAAAAAHAKAAESLAESLKKQGDTVGFTNTQLMAYQAINAGLNNSQMQAVMVAIQKVEAYNMEIEVTKSKTEADKAATKAAEELAAANEAAWAFQDEQAARQYGEELDAIEEQSRRVADAQQEIRDKVYQAWFDALPAAEKLNMQVDELRMHLDELGITDQEVFDTLKKGLEDAAVAGEKTRDVGKEIGLSFTSAFEDAAVNGKKFSEVLSGLAKDVERIILRKTITEPLSQGIGDFIDGIFKKNANGGVYSGAGISAYSGSIVSRPTVFPFARGVGLMGEAGPEAILPLRRGSDGRLGVSADGSGGGVVVNIIGAPSQPKVNKSTDQNGNMTIDVMFERVENWMGRRVAKGEGAMADALGGLGLNRAYGAQG